MRTSLSGLPTSAHSPVNSCYDCLPPKAHSRLSNLTSLVTVTPFPGGAGFPEFYSTSANGSWDGSGSVTSTGQGLHADKVHSRTSPELMAEPSRKELYTKKIYCQTSPEKWGFSLERNLPSQEKQTNE
ncbi:uncharacterized protein LOC103166504 [Ornithorhynchus anatinus]|uniref:uncharacterized protein LOC103166504 n=1 Tax=Ornithorhynchus anatinus TaxID=9258 RepID=UPI0019D4A8CA|nr:uncharacterized protein LOC103166504 [Ornithorhynchus anatinus]XP_039766453.1 uncharacterized protein LOC103166504 [Ornithorhynchus anatinus]XP_039766454.1 uncharacterized protein LOC103166504 [Ornithorhynchus anatinus]